MTSRILHILKPVLLLVCILTSAGIRVYAGDPVNGGGLKWMTLPDAMHAYQLEHKKIFIDVYTHWCGWCKKMDASTFRDSGVADYMNKNFYAVKFDAETKDTVFFKDKAYVFRPEYKANEFATMILNGQMGYPTSVYFDEDLNLIGPVPGYLTTEQMLPTLRYFGENLYKTTDWQEYIKKNLH